MTKKPKPPKITAKQEGGDDGCCYVIRMDGRAVMRGLTRREVKYYKERILREWQQKQEQSRCPPST